LSDVFRHNLPLDFIHAARKNRTQQALKVFRGQFRMRIRELAGSDTLPDQ